MEIQKTKDYYPQLQENRFYHVYNRTSNKEKLFRNDENRRFFLKQFSEYLEPYVKTYAYCLLPNHFHLMISVRELHSIQLVLNDIPAKDLTKIQKSLIERGLFEEDIPIVIQHQFRRFFISYSKAFNKMWKRKGNLLNRRFRRLEIENQVHFTQLIYYIHANPVSHKIRNNFFKYQWSSYRSFLSKKPSKLERISVLDWFGGETPFMEFHKNAYDNFLENRYAIEDFINNNQ